MKKITIFTTLTLLFISSVTFAQQERMGRKTAEQRTELITKNLTEKLSLTPEQVDEVREVVLKREKFRDAGKLSRDHQKDIEKDINKILSSDQQKQWVILKKQAKEKNKQKKTHDDKRDSVIEIE